MLNKLINLQYLNSEYKRDISYARVPVTFDILTSRKQDGTPLV